MINPIKKVQRIYMGWKASQQNQTTPTIQIDFSSTKNKSNITFQSNDPLEATKTDGLVESLSQRKPFAVATSKMNTPNLTLQGDSKEAPPAEFMKACRTASLPPGLFQQKLPDITGV